MVAGESIGAIADELFDVLPRKSWTDSQSAQAILTTDGGSWRTRHLRLSAAAARHSIAQGMWAIQQMVGTKMTADIGTKPVASERLKYLKDEMHMVPQPEVECGGEKTENPKEKTKETKEIKKAASIVRLLTLAAALSVAKGQDDEEEWSEANSDQEFKSMMVIFALVIVAITLMCQRFWTLLRSQLTQGFQERKRQFGPCVVGKV